MISRLITFVVATVAIFFGCFLILPTYAGDWPRFRGPNGTGIVDADVPLKWSKSENLTWKVKLPGRGNSSPIVIKNHLFIQSATMDGSKRMLICLDANTGTTKWIKSVEGQRTKIHQKSSFASNTPASDGERVYACHWDGDAVSLHAYDLDGNDLWSASLGSFDSQHGAGMSPIVHSGKVFINFDQDGSAEVVAFDAKTGEKIWVAPRKAYRACYSTPILRDRANGKPELVVFSTAGFTAYDPDSGIVNWSWAIPWQAGEMALRSVASPVQTGRLLIGVNGDGGGSRYSVVLDPDAAGGPRPLWEKRSNALTPYVPCPLVKENYLYWITDHGVAECLDVKSGKILWSERVFNKSVSSSPIMVNEYILAIDEGGKAVVWKADPTEYDEVWTSDVGESVFASPAVAGEKLYIRGATTLYCIGKK
jgi:outer membrane protein assembly factor BamB